MLYNLQTIREKVRNLTNRPSENDLTNEQVEDYINTFYVYSLESGLVDISLNKTLKFYTQPNRDTYTLSTLNNSDVLNTYINFGPSVYIAGINSTYYENRDQFYRDFGYTETYSKMGVGHYAAGGVPPLENTFTYTIMDKPIIPGSVTISANKYGTQGHTYDGLEVNDNGIGGWVQNGVVVVGTINYDTGAITVTFPPHPTVPDPAKDYPMLGTDILVFYKSYAPSQPYALLYYDSSFILRPIPDKVYCVEISATIRPTKMTLDTDSPVLLQWWDYIAIGASIRILNDATDFESAEKLKPLLREQYNLINRRNIMQQSNQRSLTIFNDFFQINNVFDL